MGQCGAHEKLNSGARPEALARLGRGGPAKVLAFLDFTVMLTLDANINVMCYTCEERASVRVLVSRSASE